MHETRFEPPLLHCANFDIRLALGAEASLNLISQHVISKGRSALFQFPNVRADFDPQLTRSTICISSEQNIPRISTTQKQDVRSFLRWEGTGNL
jgi:hypothetical protein